MRLLIAALALPVSTLGGAAAAQEAAPGDPAAGAAAFDRQCVSCHVVQDPSGAVLAGRNARVGPNLYGVAGRVAGSYPDYDYSDLMASYGGTGATWGEANLVPYVQNPTGYLREALGVGRGRSKMAYQVREEQDARDLWAYLSQFGAAPAEGAPAEAPAGG